MRKNRKKIEKMAISFDFYTVRINLLRCRPDEKQKKQEQEEPEMKTKVMIVLVSVMALGSMFSLAAAEPENPAPAAKIHAPAWKFSISAVPPGKLMLKSFSPPGTRSNWD